MCMHKYICARVWMCVYGPCNAACWWAVVLFLSRLIRKLRDRSRSTDRRRRVFMFNVSRARGSTVSVRTLTISARDIYFITEWNDLWRFACRIANAFFTRTFLFSPRSSVLEGKESAGFWTAREKRRSAPIVFRLFVVNTFTNLTFENIFQRILNISFYWAWKHVFLSVSFFWINVIWHFKNLGPFFYYVPGLFI